VVAQPASAQGQTAAGVASAVYNQVSGAVVRVVVSGEARGGLSPSGSGSGVVIDAGGLILTNNHVVDGARAVGVRFSNGQSRPAQVLGVDRGNDLALLRVELPPNTPVAALGDSDEVQVGEMAIAIGSPFGLDQTVTQGIVSAVDREWQPGNGRLRRDLLQTDAPINPGNSGGPLLNARGEVIGINTLIESPVRGSVGVGFAVPINAAKRALPQLQAGARLEPVWLGITGQELDATIARDQGLAVQEGVLITGVVPGGPAAGAGLRGGQGANERIPRGGDVLRAIDGVPVRTLGELADQLAHHQPGDVVTLTIVRGG
jgi:putative serine protease PepD